MSNIYTVEISGHDERVPFIIQHAESDHIVDHAVEASDVMIVMIMAETPDDALKYVRRLLVGRSYTGLEIR